MCVVGSVFLFYRVLYEAMERALGKESLEVG